MITAKKRYKSNLAKGKFPKPGVHLGLDPSVYHATQETRDYSKVVMSKSTLWAFGQNPDVWTRTPPRETTKAMVYGSVVDLLALTPDRFAQLYREVPEFYDIPEEVKPWNTRAKYCREWKAEHPDEEPPETYIHTEAERKAWNWNAEICKAWKRELPDGVEPVDFSAMERARAALKELDANDDWCGLMENAETQVAAVTKVFNPGTETSALLKCMIDIVPDREGDWGDWLVDLKELGRMDNERRLSYVILDGGYHVQAALYRDLWHAATGEWRENFGLAFQRSTAPFDIYVKPIDDESLAVGRRIYQELIHEWCKFVKTGEARNPLAELESIGIPDHAKE